VLQKVTARILDVPQWARWGVTGTFFGFLNWLMLAPAQTFNTIHLFLAQQDKIAHLGIFLTMALLVHWSLPPAFRAGWRRVAVIGAMLAYGASIELAQPLLTRASRGFERLDLICNVAGIAGGWLLFAALAASRQVAWTSVSCDEFGDEWRAK